jgi:endo-1,4-beta-xylanase
MDAAQIGPTGGTTSEAGGAIVGTIVAGAGGAIVLGGTLGQGGGSGNGGATVTNLGTGGTIDAGGSTASVALPKKFFGNIDTGNNVRSDFATYWDQFVPENAGKWPSVQSSAGVFNWGRLDAMYKYCDDHNIVFKEHCFVWGSSQPSWINNSNAVEVIQNWMKAFCERYPKTRIIDVVNEPLHAPPAYRDGLGGKGASGWDWIVNSFKWAHEACPNAVLVLNDYNIIEYSSEHTRIVELVKGIIAAGAPIMAIGSQAHDVSKVSLTTVQKYLADLISQTGLPVYITEMDLAIADDVQQAAVMKDLVTTFWNDPNVPGITYWGYIVGATWRSNTGLMTDTGAMRPAMTWLMDFLHR